MLECIQTVHKALSSGPRSTRTRTVILALKSWKQEHQKSRVIFSIVSLRPGWSISLPVSKKKKSEMILVYQKYNFIWNQYKM